ncbi:MAG: hypothetical protein LC790_13170 [Actinobacteria bacterium]|nr:hypothetical protein [Actinomycetota bacterium]
MIAPDSSVLVAGADPAHPFHGEALAELIEVRNAGVVVAHTVAEVTAVLTAAAYGYPPTRVSEYLAQFLDRETVGVEPALYPSTVTELTDAGIVGGAVYDGLIAIGARSAGATLVSLDRRAAPTYRRCGVAFRLLND